jgi:hypothetical protein
MHFVAYEASGRAHTEERKVSLVGLHRKGFYVPGVEFIQSAGERVHLHPFAVGDAQHAGQGIFHPGHAAVAAVLGEDAPKMLFQPVKYFAVFGIRDIVKPFAQADPRAA